MKRAVLYARVSKGEESDETTVGIQLARCESFCEAHGWTIVDRFQDVGVSGFDKSVNRPEYLRMIESVRAGNADAMVVFKIDRLTRQTKQILVEDTGVEFASVNDSIDTSTPTGRLMLQIMGAMAQLESENTSLRVKSRLEDNAKSGKAHRGAPDRRPFGWQEDWTSAHPVEAVWLRDAIRMYVDGSSMGAAVRWLNEQGARMSSGGEVKVGQMSRILRNPRLIGLRNFRDEELLDSPVEPIIDRDTWNRLQDRLGGGTRVVSDSSGNPVKLTKTKGRRAGRVSVLGAGLLVCTRCGKPMRFAGGKSNRYVCADPEVSCSAIGADRVHRLVFKDAREMLTGMERYDGAADTSTELREEATRLRGRLETILRALYVENPSESERDVLENLRVELVEKISDLDRRMVATSSGATLDERGRWSHEAWWDAATDTEKRDVVRYLYERIDVRPADVVREELGGHASWDQLTRSRMHIVLNQETFGERDFPLPDWLRTDG